MVSNLVTPNGILSAHNAYVCIQQMLNGNLDSSVLLYKLKVIILLFSYFETYGSIPELNDDHSEKKFTIMRKVTDSSTIHKGDNTVSTGHCTTVTVFYREC